MARVRLVNVDLPYKKIMQGRKWIGRTWKAMLRASPPGYYANIGTGANRIEVGPYTTERQAFDEAAARYFGQADAEALRQHNAAVRAENRAIRGRRVSRRRLGTGSDALDELERLLASAFGAPARTHTKAKPERREIGEDDFVWDGKAKYK